METLDDMRDRWTSCALPRNQKPVDQQSLGQIFKKRVNVELKQSMQFFWASLVLQIMVYSMLAHVIVRYWNTSVPLWATAGIVLYIPFTIVLVRRFSRIANPRISGETRSTLHSYIRNHYEELSRFFRFKKRYEAVLIPLSVLIGTVITFEVFFPGGVTHYINAAVITFFVALASCAYAIIRENRRSFVEPLKGLESILREFE